MHPNIKQAKELLIYTEQSGKFTLFEKKNFKMLSKCIFCPLYASKALKLEYCGHNIDSWYKLKLHLKFAEKRHGHRIAFSRDEELPDVSVYKKYRAFGYLAKFIETKSFYIYDFEEKDFVLIRIDDNCNEEYQTIYYEKLSRKYLMNGKCNYCKCGIKWRTMNEFLSHISKLELKYYCYLIIEKLEDNSFENSLKINKLIDNEFLNPIQNSNMSQNDTSNFESVGENNAQNSNTQKSLIELLDLIKEELIEELNEKLDEKFQNLKRQLLLS